MEINPDNNQENERNWYFKLKDLINFSVFIDSDDVNKMSESIKEQLKKGIFNKYQKEEKEFNEFYRNFKNNGN